MKKVMGVLVALTILGICSSSFGYLLVYNVSTTVKGADDDTGLKATVPLKGFLILNLNNPTSVADANLILYGNDANSPKKQKVYVEINYSSMDDGHYVDIWQVGDFFFLEIAEYISGPFYFDVLVMGKLKAMNIGPLVGNGNVASSLKGSMIVWDGFLLGPSADQDISGTSNISLTLNKSGTNWANGDNEEGPGGDPELMTQEDLVDRAIGPDGILTDKGFDPAILP